MRRNIDVGILTICMTSSVWAEDFSDLRYLPAAQVAEAISSVELTKAYALGVNRFDVDAHTEIIGWRISDSWYFGRQDGLDSGLTLVWQQEENQVSVSKDGVRLTRRF